MRALKLPLVLALVASLHGLAHAEGQTPPQSAMDAPLFYQLLIGELEAQRGELGTAYQVLLDAARRTGDEALYRRVIALAIQARAGSEALLAAKDWRATVGSVEAQQHVVRLAVALGRLAEAAEPLVDWLERTPETAQRAALLAALPQLLRNLPDRERPLNDMEPVLATLRDSAAQTAERRQLAASLVSALALHAGNDALALNQLRQAEQEWPQDALPAWLALNAMRLNPDAEALVGPRLSGRLDLHTAYARALASGHRSLEALAQFQALERLEPEQAAHRYATAALQLDLRRANEALAAIEDYLTRLPSQGADEQRIAAQLIKAQAHVQLKQWASALRALDAIPEPKRSADDTYWRASIEARQGQLEPARKRLREMPADTPEQRERRTLLEVQLLRDADQWPAALEFLAQALKDDPADLTLLYEHAMCAERLGRFELMEQQLRRVMELDPRHHHAHNALGYSLADRNQRLPEARALIERAIALAGHEPAFIDSLGWVAFREGKLDEAERWLRQAHRARPDAEIGAHLAEVLWQQGRRSEASEVADQAQAHEPDNALLKATRKRLRL